jgi:hypothetical protein
MKINGSPCGNQTSPIRNEVIEFVRSTETLLLSPILLKPDLNQKECDLIAEYVQMMSLSKHPWSKSLPIKYT